MKHWEGETMAVDITRKVPPGERLFEWYREVTRWRHETDADEADGCRDDGWCYGSRPRRVSLLAHHAFAAEFDAQEAGQLQGHGHEDGVDQSACLASHGREEAGRHVENWAFEAGTPNVLFRRGFTKESLLPGTQVVIDGYQAKDGSRRANGRDLTFPDGRKLFLGSSGTGAPYELTPNDQKVRPKRSEALRSASTVADHTCRASLRGTRGLRARLDSDPVIGPLLPRRMIG